MKKRVFEDTVGRVRQEVEEAVGRGRKKVEQQLAEYSLDRPSNTVGIDDWDGPGCFIFLLQTIRGGRCGQCLSPAGGPAQHFWGTSYRCRPYCSTLYCKTVAGPPGHILSLRATAPVRHSTGAMQGPLEKNWIYSFVCTTQAREGKLAEDAVSTLHSLLHCNYTRLETHLQHSRRNHFLNQHNK